MQADEIERAVRPARQAGLHLGQSAGQRAQEAVVEAAHPGMAAAGNGRAMAAGARHRLQLGQHIDDADPGNEVARQPPGHDHIVLAGDEIDEQVELAGQLVRGDVELVAGEQLGGDRQLAVDVEVGEDAAGDIANSGHAPRAQVDRHRHRAAGEHPGVPCASTMSKPVLSNAICGAVIR